MIQLKKNKYPEVSILLSIISIAASVFINIQIAKQYLRSVGKNRALFGLYELLQFGYQYYVAILGFIALVMAILGIKGDNRRSLKLSAILLSVLALMAVFVRIWRLFV